MPSLHVDSLLLHRTNFRPATKFLLMVLIPTTDVSVIIPCLNEIATIGSCVESAFALFETFHYRGEVLVIDNGSTDNSAHLASVKGATIHYASTRGYRSACMTGLQHAKGNFLILGDRDGTYDFLEGIHLLTQLQSGFDVVIGSRLSGHIVSQAMPWLHRYVGVPILTWLLNRATSLALSDAHCGLRAITQTCFRQLACRCEGICFGINIGSSQQRVCCGRGANYLSSSGRAI